MEGVKRMGHPCHIAPLKRVVDTVCKRFSFSTEFSFRTRFSMSTVPFGCTPHISSRWCLENSQQLSFYTSAPSARYCLWMTHSMVVAHT